MTQVDLQYGAATHVGLVREANEDAHLVAPPVFVVADGMGGHDHGDVASAFVIEEFAPAGRDRHRRRDRRRGRDRRARARSTTGSTSTTPPSTPPGELLFGAGTTAVVALLVADVAEPYWLVANLGDSRGYLFADRRARPGDRRPQPGAGAGRRRHHRRCRCRRSSRPAHHDPRPRRTGAPRTRSLHPSRGGFRADAVVLGRGERDARARRHRTDPGRAPGPGGSRGKGGRGCGGGRWSRQRNRRRRGCGGIDQRDAARHRRAAAEYGAGEGHTHECDELIWRSRRVVLPRRPVVRGVRAARHGAVARVAARPGGGRLVAGRRRRRVRRGARRAARLRAEPAARVRARRAPTTARPGCCSGAPG